MKKPKISKLYQLMIGLISVVLAGFIAYFLYANAMVQPLEKGRAAIIQIAKNKAGLEHVATYNLVTTDQTYYSLTGENAQKEKIAVLIPKNQGGIKVVAMADGVAQASLPQKDAVTIDVALYKDKPVWEVNSRTGFTIYDFKTGKEIIAI